MRSQRDDAFVYLQLIGRWPGHPGNCPNRENAQAGLLPARITKSRSSYGKKRLE